MVKPASTVGTCCYIGCKKSFLTDKETRFFKFPDDLERRKKWITNCGNPELGTLAERQLRGKRICINHFPPRAFTNNKNELKDTAVPTPTATPPVAKTSTTVSKPNIATNSTPTAVPKPPIPTVIPTKVTAPSTPVSTVKTPNSTTVTRTKTLSSASKPATKTPQTKASTVAVPQSTVKQETSMKINTTASPKGNKSSNANPVTRAIINYPPCGIIPQSLESFKATEALNLPCATDFSTDPPTPLRSKWPPSIQPTAPPEAQDKINPEVTPTIKPAVKTTITKTKTSTSVLSTAPKSTETPKSVILTAAQIKTSLASATTTRQVKVSPMVYQTRSSTPATSLILKAVAMARNNSISNIPTEDVTTTTVPVVAKRGKGRPPKIIREVAVKSEPIEIPEIPELPIIQVEPQAIEDSTKHISMPSLVLANDLVNPPVAPSTSETPVNIEKATTPPTSTKKRKRTKLSNAEKDLKSKLRKIAVGILQPHSEGLNVDMSSVSSDEDDVDEVSHNLGSSEEEKRTDGLDNKEFTRFYKILKGKVVLPESWSLGAILWDPSTKMKVIPASEVDMSANGTVRLKRCVQIYENMQTKVTIDGFDLTHRYDVKEVSGHNDVTRLILLVARSKICCGIKNVSSEDAMYFTDAIPRGTTFYSEACPVIIGKQSTGSLCSSCLKLRNAIKRRKTEQKHAIEMRRAKRPSSKTVNSPFGKALYTLLSTLMADESDPKSKKKKRLTTMYSRGHNVCIKEKEAEVPTEKVAPERATNSASISYIMQDIVSKMSLNKAQQEAQSQFFKTEDEDMEMQIINGSVDANSGNLVVQNAADFTLAEGQEYELIGEVDPSDVQVVEMIKDRPKSPPQYQIIQVDDHTLAQMNYSGMFLQDSDGQIVNVTDMDMNDQSMGQLLKVISSNSTDGF